MRPCKCLSVSYCQSLNLLLLQHDEDVRLLRQEILVARAIGAAHVPQAVQQPSPYQEPERRTYTMKIANFTRKLSQAISNHNAGTIVGEPFFSSHGYRMELEVDLNGAPEGYTGYISVYLRLLKGHHDGRLRWPFTKPYRITVVDQQDDLNQTQNISDTVHPEGEEAFKRPGQHKSDCWGISDFAKHSTLRSRQYIRNHTVYIEVVVHP